MAVSGGSGLGRVPEISLWPAQHAAGCVHLHIVLLDTVTVCSNATTPAPRNPVDDALQHSGPRSAAPLRCNFGHRAHDFCLQQAGWAACTHLRHCSWTSRLRGALTTHRSCARHSIGGDMCRCRGNMPCAPLQQLQVRFLWSARHSCGDSDDETGRHEPALERIVAQWAAQALPRQSACFGAPSAETRRLN